MIPLPPCYVCHGDDHRSTNCPELCQETREPNAPQPTGPRGGDDD